MSDWFNASEMVVGSLPKVNGNEEDMAWQRAANTFNTEFIHLVTHEHNGKVFFLATPSRALAGANAESCSQIASIIPGGPNFKDEDAFYTINASDEQNIVICLLYKDGNCQLWANDAAFIEATSKRYPDIPVIDLSEKKDLEPVEWKVLSLREEKFVRKFSLFTILITLAISVILIAYSFILGTFNIASSINSEQKLVENQRVAGQLIIEANRASKEDVQPHLYTLMVTQNDILRLGGLIVSYTSEGGVVKWEAIFPQSINSSSVDAIGGKIKERLDNGNVVVSNH